MSIFRLLALRFQTVEFVWHSRILSHWLLLELLDVIDFFLADFCIDLDGSFRGHLLERSNPWSETLGHGRNQATITLLPSLVWVPFCFDIYSLFGHECHLEPWTMLMWWVGQTRLRQLDSWKVELSIRATIPFLAGYIPHGQRPRGCPVGDESNVFARGLWTCIVLFLWCQLHLDSLTHSNAYNNPPRRWLQQMCANLNLAFGPNAILSEARCPIHSFSCQWFFLDQSWW